MDATRIQLGRNAFINVYARIKVSLPILIIFVSGGLCFGSSSWLCSGRPSQ